MKYKFTNMFFVSRISSLITYLLCVIFMLYGISTICKIETIYAYDSRAEWEASLPQNYGANPVGFFSAMADYIVNLAECIISQAAILPVDYSQNCIPQTVSQNSAYNKDCYCSDSTSSVSGTYNKALTYMGAAGIISHLMIFFVAATLAFVVPIIGPILFTYLIVQEFLKITTVCYKSYILAPHEYVNDVEGRTQICTAGYTGSQTQCKFTQMDIPFFFNCISGAYGDMGDLYCTDLTLCQVAECYGGPARTAAKCAPLPPNIPKCKCGVTPNFSQKGNPPGVGGIIVEQQSWDGSGTASVSWTSDDVKKGIVKSIPMGFFIKPLSEAFGMDVANVYMNVDGQIKLCAVVINEQLLTMVIGCTYVPPPSDPYLTVEDGIISKTRCKYFLEGRSDLRALGISLLPHNGGNPLYVSAARFLASEMHFISTIVGCIKDVLYDVVSPPLDDTSSYNDKIPSLFRGAQLAVRPIALSVLVFFVSFIGYKMLFTMKPPSLGEITIHITKVVFVILMVSATTVSGDAIYSLGANDLPNSQKDMGLYTTLVNASDGLMNVFMDIIQMSDVMKLCFYPMAEDTTKNMLRSDSLVSIVSSSEGILGDNKSVLNDMSTVYQWPYSNLSKKEGVIMTIWDYLDCKVATYLNMGSCRYTLSGMLLFWLLGSAALFSGSSGIILWIVAIIYIFVLFLLIFRFLYVIIIALFTITVLMIIAPFMSLFILFEKTKDTFNNWIRMVIGYLLFPGLLFSFIAFTISTLDAIMYGNTVQVSQWINKNCSTSTSETCSYKKLCKEPYATSSLYCGMMDVMNGVGGINNCGSSINEMISKSTTTKSNILGTFTLLKSDVIDAIYPGILQMMLCALIFYLLLDSVIIMIESLTGVSGLNPKS